MDDWFVVNILMPDDHRHHIVLGVEVGFQKTDYLYLSHTVSALIDTGAERSCISGQLANELGLQSDKDTRIITATGIEAVPLYAGIDLILKGNDKTKMYDNLEVAECFGNSKAPYDFVIGMDILNSGDIIISNAGGKTMFSFRTPPSKNNFSFMDIDGKIHEREIEDILESARLFNSK
jgi:predicted aspartyl protease